MEQSLNKVFKMCMIEKFMRNFNLGWRKRSLRKSLSSKERGQQKENPSKLNEQN